MNRELEPIEKAKRRTFLHYFILTVFVLSYSTPVLKAQNVDTQAPSAPALPASKLFGSPSLEYSESYRARPYSKRFVRHLDGWYAQSHPEEDFAETVAIWLTPGLDWRNQYRGWKALEKQ